MTAIPETHATILIVEDEAQIRKFLRITLEAHGFTVLEERLGNDGLECVARKQPDLVILDLGLPDISGLTVLNRLREWTNVPVLVLSVQANESDKVSALDAGANDYVTKPFGISELMARVRSLLRWHCRESELESVFELGDLHIDLLAHRVRVAGSEINLSRKEYELLKFFVSNPGRVLTHRQIICHVWGPSVSDETHYLRVLVKQLRQKLGDSPSRPRFIATVQGVGYRLIC